MRQIRGEVFAEILSYKGGRDPTRDLKAFREAAGGAYVQTLDAAAVGGRRHLILTLKQTIESARTSQLLAEKPEVDFLLRVAGTRQIAEAVREAGARPRSDSVMVLFGARESVKNGVTSVCRIRELRPFISRRPGRKAAKRVGARESASVIGGGDAVARLLAEQAALLMR
jgi:tRNA threonylcarbamoyladenosine modification (KEOPS) complex Cgi121 subunit